MNIEKIHEPLAVLASFSGGAAQPVRFRWQGRTYKVEAVNARWIDRGPQAQCTGLGGPDDRQGEVYELYYSLQSGGQTYIVHFSSKELQWWLDEVVVE